MTTQDRREMPAMRGPNNKRAPAGNRTIIARTGAKNIRMNVRVERASSSERGSGRVAMNSMDFEEKYAVVFCRLRTKRSTKEKPINIVNERTSRVARSPSIKGDAPSRRDINVSMPIIIADEMPLHFTDLLRFLISLSLFSVSCA
ncbi:MAG: hypothetical protein ACFFFC_16200 [Candidatus Thorarchaeota archaeon]